MPLIIHHICDSVRPVWRFWSLHYFLLPLIRKWYILPRIWWRGQRWRDRCKELEPHDRVWKCWACCQSICPLAPDRRESYRQKEDGCEAECPGEIATSLFQTDLLWRSEGTYARILRKFSKAYDQKFLGRLLARKRQRTCSQVSNFARSDCIFRSRIKFEYAYNELQVP